MFILLLECVILPPATSGVCHPLATAREARLHTECGASSKLGTVREQETLAVASGLGAIWP